MKMAPAPDLELRRTHILITKTLLTLYDLDLASDSRSDQSIRAQGHAGLGQDKSIDAKANFNSVPLRQWLPAEWKGRLKGSAFGDIHWTGRDPKLESSSAEGSLRIHNGRVDNVPLLNKLAELAQKKSFERLDLNECSLSFAWRHPEIQIKDITIEEKGKFRIEGEISIKRSVLRGTIRLGLTREFWIGCRILKKYLADVQAGTCGRMCIYPARLMNPGRTSASASSNSSRNRPALISVSCFASSTIG
jgi:hypothetical protein